MFPKVETMSRLTESLNVAVSELFKSDIVPSAKKLEEPVDFLPKLI